MTSRMECPTLGDGSSMYVGSSFGGDKISGDCIPPMRLFLQMRMGKLDMCFSGVCAGCKVWVWSVLGGSLSHFSTSAAFVHQSPIAAN